MTTTKVQAYAAPSAVSALAPLGNEEWDRLLKQDVRYRFVIDLASLKT